ncbi:MAG: DNA primase [Burkholderiaceae bacterium]|nr:DNA primase [Burkholderiaceae bacterium]
MAIPQTFIHELLTRVDVVEVVGRYVQLKKGGANFMGLCPFHGEKSPSFSVSPTKQFYHCFGCGKSGDAINFLMEQTGQSFREAVEDLAQQHGLQVPDDDTSPEERARASEQRKKQATLSDVLERAGDSFRRHLKTSPRAVDYLKGRGLSGEIARRFGLGYAPEGWRGLASVFPDYTDPLLAESGLVIVSQEDGQEEKRYDRFRDRVMFPIRNIKGECIGFGGRVLGDEKPKYLNSPETPVFSKGRELYGLFEAREALRDAGYVLVTEGYMDVVALAQLGFPNAVATLGTACTTEHAQKLFRFTDSVVFSFDGDAAGRRAARRALDAALPHASDTRSVKFLFLPAEHDPDSYIREFGAEAFSRQVAEAMPLSRFLIEAAREDLDLGTAEGRAHMASNARPLWQALPDGALRRQLLGELAGLVQLSAQELADLWSRSAASGPGRTAPRAEPQQEPAGDGAPPRPAHGWREGNGTGGGSRPPWKSKAPARSPGRRVQPMSRADHAARLLLAHMHAWERLSSEEHAMLCELPEPHGPLFAWIDSQFHEHGPLTWTHLREALPGQPFESLADRLMAGADVLALVPDATAGAHAAMQEWEAELRDLLKRMLVERLKALEAQAIEESSLDPSALERYRALYARRRELEATA